MKKSGKKLIAFLMAASLMAAPVFPMQGTAAEEIERGTEQETTVLTDVTEQKLSDMLKEPEKESADAAKESEKESADAEKEPEKESADAEKEPEKESADVPKEPEEPKREEPSDVAKEPEAEEPGVLPQDTEMGDIPVMPFSYDINQPVIENFELVENGQTLTKDDTLHFNLWAYDADRAIRSITVDIAPRTSGYQRNITFRKSEDTKNLYTATFACKDLIGYEGEYYVYQVRLEDEANNYVVWPVREGQDYRYTFTFQHTRSIDVSDFQIQKNTSNPDGKLRPGDTVTYRAHVDCVGMEIKYADLYLKTVTSDPSKSIVQAMSYDSKTQTLEATVNISGFTRPTEWRVNKIEIYAGNRYHSSYPEEKEPEKDLRFTVVNDTYDSAKPVVKSITIDKNGQMVKAGEYVTVKVKVEEANPISTMRVGFRPQASSSSMTYCSLGLNTSTMEYTGKLLITQDTYPTRWDLTYLYIYDVNENKTYLSDFREDWDTARPWYYTVDPEGYLDDTKAPVIESITIDKNGQFVYPGDTVTLTVKVDEENPSDRGYAYFYPQVSNVSGSRTVYLYYNADIKGYVGSIYIDNDTYPCEWMLTELGVSDVKGHRTSLNDFQPNWKDTCPWYFRVETDDTYREDVKDTTFSMYGYVQQENGSYTYGPVVENKAMKVGRRDSLEGLGICPALPAEGIQVNYIDERTGREIAGDTELFFGNSPQPFYEFRAVYDKVCVNVILTYISKDKGMTMAFVPQFVDPGTTYGEMLASFQPPADADQDLLARYQLDGSREETAQVEDLGYVGVEAKYNDCLVAWNTTYLDENGNEVSKVITKSYEKNTPIHTALTALEGPAAPEGLEFEAWALPGIRGDETIFHEMTNLNVTAVYKGKTTAEVAYTYRGADGKLVSGSRLLALEGEQLSYRAAFEAVKKDLEDVTHLKGLVFSDWIGKTAGTDIARYKKMNIQAQYANCVAVLKYPQNVYEYVILEKGSRFTLPVENETYMEIQWEGYAQGQTVTITGDQEFLVADAKRKDGSLEGTTGGKLPAEEIEKIIADIAQSGSGETIHVEMKKATVVPKEILEAIKGKEVNIVLDMGAYSWSIGGDEVVASELKDIDLEVIVDTDGIPPAIVDSLAEGKPSTQITLTHEGEFGFRADLTVNLGVEHSGSTGKMYYYDSSGKLVYMDAGEIGPDGNISLSFSHASEYVVIFEKASVDSSTGTNSGGKVEGMIPLEPDGKNESDSVIPKSPKTGE